MWVFSSFVYSIGLISASDIFARSSMDAMFIVVVVSGGFWVVSAIISLCGAMSFSIGFGGGGGLFVR